MCRLGSRLAFLCIARHSSPRLGLAAACAAAEGESPLCSVHSAGAAPVAAPSSPPVAAAPCGADPRPQLIHAGRASFSWIVSGGISVCAIRTRRRRSAARNRSVTATSSGWRCGGSSSPSLPLSQDTLLKMLALLSAYEHHYAHLALVCTIVSAVAAA